MLKRQSSSLLLSRKKSHFNSAKRTIAQCGVIPNSCIRRMDQYSAHQNFCFSSAALKREPKTIGTTISAASAASIILLLGGGGYYIHSTSAAEAVQPLSKNQMEDRYYITDESLGQGGYGNVRRGIRKSDNQPVAIKSLCKRSTSAAAFWAEVELLRIAGAHPNILSLEDVYESEDEWFIVQQCANEGEVLDRLVESGAYSEAEARTTLHALCDALRHMHEKGITHGDIKPENILLHDGQMCLVDFGVASRVGEARAAEMTTTTTNTCDSTFCFNGTVAYAPPELLDFESRNSVSTAADMFAFGIVMYIVLYGVHPFDKTNSLSDEEIRQNILKGNVEWKEGIVSKDAVDLLQRLLDPNPKTRITASEAVNHPWLLPDADLSTSPRPGIVEHLRKFQRGRRRLRASILAVLLNAVPFQGAGGGEGISKNDREAVTFGISSDRESAANKAGAVISALGVFDRDEKGYISAGDLKRVAAELGENLNDEELKEMVVAADGDPDTGSKVAYDDVKMAVCSLRARTFENGDVIIREGVVDHHHVFYLLMEGEVEVSCKIPRADQTTSSSSNTKRIILRRIKKGEYFGEIELLQPDGQVHPRIASYRCVSRNCKVLSLLPGDLDTIKDVYESVENTLHDRVTEHAHDHLIKWVEHAKGHVRRLQYDAGETICHEGATQDSFYILVDGKVKVTKRGVIVETLTGGDYFPLGVSGQLEKSNIKERTASVTCIKPTTVIEVGGDSFRSFLRDYDFMNAYYQEQVLARAKERDERRKKVN